jgi:hypothetical protein
MKPSAVLILIVACGGANKPVANTAGSTTPEAQNQQPGTEQTLDGDAPVEDKLEGPQLDALIDAASRAYDKLDLDEARSNATKVLAQHPTHTRMLRIMVSAHCIEGDNAEAQKYFSLLTPPDREQMKTRCARYGVTFTEPP